MRSRLHTQLAKSENAAVAPTVALSLFGLLAVGGIAFDYARMATMDTELQAAADQAALAAASQLDGKTGTCDRAARAAVNLVANQTLFANETGSNRSIVVPLETTCDATGNIKFWQNKAKTTAATTDSNAKFVEVTVNTREAYFALTPIVASLSSGALGATAFAGLGSAICKVPPVMMCNPNEPLSTAFDGNAMRGKGLKLITGNADAPGNFGYLDTQAVSGNGTPELKTLLGYDTPPGNCSPVDGVDLKTGMRVEVMDALNTRFDIYDSQNCPQPTGLSGTCSPSRNARKDLVRNNQCTTGGQGWVPSSSPYRPATIPATANAPATAAALTSGYPDMMGYPRDYCHAIKQSDQTCGNIGSGAWDRDAYFRVNYSWNDQATWTSNTGLPANATRYQVYEWETAHPTVSTPSGNRGIAVTQTIGGKTAHGIPICNSPGITPGGTNVDRRRISVAVINCEALGLNGAETGVTVNKWIDVFLVEPSIDRGNGTNKFTERKEVYVEVIGETASGAGSTAGQVVRRDVPYLIE
jgi:Flp pilus assembly protein TadG